MQTISFEVDDAYYQELISKVGKENLSDFFQKLSEPYFLLYQKADNVPMPNNRPYRLGALSDIKVLDDIDSFADDNNYNDNHHLTNNTSKQSNGIFDEFFGVLHSDKAVSIDDMNTAIKMRGGQL